MMLARLLNTETIFTEKIQFLVVRFKIYKLLSNISFEESLYET